MTMEPSQTIKVRVMTYNVHSCIGMDAKVSVDRIAGVIAQHEPDIVALQELDIKKKRSKHIDQPHQIASALEMMYHFHPNIAVEEERFGSATLSRFPMRLVHAGKLPGEPGPLHRSPRGALWTEIQIDKLKVQLINTHLDLRKKECLEQAKALLGPEWIGHPDCVGPVILTGDFNALPDSKVCRCLGEVLKDSQRQIKGHRPKATWFGHLPFRRIDHIFISHGIEVQDIKVSRTKQDRIASDHLPLIADLTICDHLA